MLLVIEDRLGSGNCIISDSNASVGEGPPPNISKIVSVLRTNKVMRSRQQTVIITGVSSKSSLGNNQCKEVPGN